MVQHDRQIVDELGVGKGHAQLAYSIVGGGKALLIEQQVHGGGPVSDVAARGIESGRFLGARNDVLGRR